MVLTLRVRSGDVDPPLELHFDAPRLVVGRSPSCELQLPDPSVSRRHATIEQRGSGYVVVDQSSESGTFSGLEPLGPRAPHGLESGELLRFGRVWVEVRLGATERVSDAMASREVARRLVESGRGSDAEALGLRVVAAPGEAPGDAVTLSEPGRRYVVGSHPDAALRLDAPGGVEELVALSRRGDQVWVTALDPAADAELGGHPLVVGARAAWPRRASLRVGTRRLTWADPTADLLGRLERAPCERLPPGEPVDPPVGVQAPTPRPRKTPTPRAATPRAPRAEPEPRPSAEPNAPRSFAANAGPERWTLADAGVFLLALGVLMLSVWAIQWIARLGQA